ncbi:MAG: hypothetical protein Phog2KO_31930 [Phototrophicaceae bacterium]
MLYCFLDTNMFLHFQPFDNISWINELKVNEVTICITFKTLSELDEKKREHKHRNRVISVQKKIKQYKDKSIAENISFQIIQEASYKWLRENGFDPENPDSKIIGNISYFKSQHIADEIIVVTDDVNFQLRAEAKGLRYFEIDEKYRLPSELSAEQKELQKLRREIQKIENATPKLKMMFRDKNDEEKNQLQFEVDFSETIIFQNKLEQLKQKKYEELEYIDDIKNGNSSYSNLISSMRIYGETIYPTQEEVDKYHEDLDNFIHTEYTDYLKSQWMYNLDKEQLFSFRLALINSGTKPAQNVDVHLHFQDVFELLEDLEFELEEPYPPTRPKPKNRNSILMTYSPTIQRYYNEPSPTSFSINKTDNYEYEVDIHLDTLKHHFAYSKELFIVFNPINVQKTGYAINYEITADNIPNLIEGKLSILLSKL